MVDARTGVNIRVFATAAERDAATPAGLRRLLRLATASPVKSLEKKLDTRRRLTLAGNPDGSLQALLDDCADAAVGILAPAPLWTRAEFEAVRKRVGEALMATTAEVLARTEKVLAALQQVQMLLPEAPPPAQAEALADVRAQLAALVAPGFVAATGAAHLGDLVRYLTAISRRLERLPHGLSADRERMQRVRAVQDAYDEVAQALSPARAAGPDMVDIARMIQEFRVSLWAQQLGTARPVSEQRIYRALDAVVG